MALTELTAALAISTGTEPRTILLACDDYSAVSCRVPLWQLYERGRSLGIGVQVSAQSWQGLGTSEDERYRIAATADGGLWLLRTPTPSPSANWPAPTASSRPPRRSSAACGATKGPPASSTPGPSNPQIARGLDTGQAAYIHGGGATWVQIARPHPSHSRHPQPSPRLSSSSRSPRKKKNPSPGRRLRRRRWTTRSGRRSARDRPGPVRHPGAARPSRPHR